VHYSDDADWIEAFPYDATRNVEGAAVFERQMALEGRQHGLPQIWLVDVDATGRLSAPTLRMLKWREQLCTVATGANRVFASNHVRVTYESLTTPVQYLDVDMRAGVEASDTRDTLIR
jgi:protease II